MVKLYGVLSSKNLEIFSGKTLLCRPGLGTEENQFLEGYLTFIQANHWSFGGGVRTIVDSYYINEDGTPAEPVCPKEDK